MTAGVGAAGVRAAGVRAAGVTRVLVLHAYSASNAGDGLLVRQTLGLVREALGIGQPALGQSIDFTLVALHPKTFVDSVFVGGSFAGRPFFESSATIIDSSLSRRGYTAQLRRVLASLRSDSPPYDLVVAVGGGYLRTGHPVEALKTTLAHGLQLFAASRAAQHHRVPVVYLPQSVGPLRFGTRGLVRRLLGAVDAVYLRDDRSVAELCLDNAWRVPDLALMRAWEAPGAGEGEGVDVDGAAGSEPDPIPVLSVREVRGELSPRVRELARLLGRFDGYVQSRGAGNDDSAVMASLRPEQTLDAEELFGADGVLAPGQPRRVVIAVRLHAAIMAINAGHWVIHLAYERKGFGAFDDLGLPGYVVNVNEFDPAAIAVLAQRLLTDHRLRDQYDAAVAEARVSIDEQRGLLVRHVRQLVLPGAVAPAPPPAPPGNSTLSVVIPAYNASATVERAIASARLAGAAASMTTQVIVVDDGSADATASLARTAGALCVQQPNAGAAAARTAGVARAEGDYVVFLDADDELVPDGVARSIELLESDPGLVVSAGTVIGVGGGTGGAARTGGSANTEKPFPIRFSPVTTTSLLEYGHGPWPPAAAVIRRSALLAAAQLHPEPLHPRFAEDYELLIRLSMTGRIDVRADATCRYSMAGGKSVRSAGSAIEAKEQIRRYYADYLGLKVELMTGRRVAMAARARVARALWASGRHAAALWELGRWAAADPLYAAATLRSRAGVHSRAGVRN